MLARLFQSVAHMALAIVLFGQLAFSATQYYFGTENPSLPFWIILFVTSAVILTTDIKKVRILKEDIFLLLAVVVLATSFILFGKSEYYSFYYHLVFFVCLPYVFGRIVGRYTSLTLFSTFLAILILSLILIGFELARQPSLFWETDRLRLFVLTTGGDPTAFYISAVFGSGFLVALTTLISGVYWTRVSKLSESIFLGSIASISFLTLLLFGSRGGILAALLSAVLMTFLVRRGRSILFRLTLIVTLLATLVVAFQVMPLERKELVRQFSNTAMTIAQKDSKASSVKSPSNLSTTDGNEVDCLQTGNSLTARLRMLSEAWRLIEASPWWGVGASNYGHEYCGAEGDLVSPHSSLAQILVELGILGSLIWYALFASVAWRVFAAILTSRNFDPTTARPYLAIFLFFFIQSQFSGNIYYDYQMFMVMGLLVSALQAQGAAFRTNLLNRL